MKKSTKVRVIWTASVTAVVTIAAALIGKELDVPYSSEIAIGLGCGLGTAIGLYKGAKAEQSAQQEDGQDPA